jgi:CBS domain-containing protein
MFEQKITGRDIMTSPVYTVQPTDRVKRVIALLCTHRISGMPVVDRKDESRGLPRNTQEESGNLMRQVDGLITTRSRSCESDDRQRGLYRL